MDPCSGVWTLHLLKLPAVRGKHSGRMDTKGAPEDRRSGLLLGDAEAQRIRRWIPRASLCQEEERRSLVYIDNEHGDVFTVQDPSLAESLRTRGT